MTEMSPFATTFIFIDRFLLFIIYYILISLRRVVDSRVRVCVVLVILLTTVCSEFLNIPVGKLLNDTVCIEMTCEYILEGRETHKAK